MYLAWPILIFVAILIYAAGRSEGKRESRDEINELKEQMGTTGATSSYEYYNDEDDD